MIWIVIFQLTNINLNMLNSKINNVMYVMCQKRKVIYNNFLHLNY